MNTLELLKNIEQYNHDAMILSNIVSMEDEQCELKVSNEDFENEYYSTGLNIDNYKKLANFYGKVYNLNISEQANRLNFYIKNGYHLLDNITLKELLSHFYEIYNKQDTIYLQGQWDKDATVFLFNFYVEINYNSALGQHYENIRKILIKEKKLKYFLEFFIFYDFLDDEDIKTLTIEQFLEDVIHYAKYDG